MVFHLEAATLPKVTCMVYFEVSMTYSEIYTKSFSVFKKKNPDFSDVHCIRVTLMLETNLYDEYHCSGQIFILVTVLCYFSRRLNSVENLIEEQKIF